MNKKKIVLLVICLILVCSGIFMMTGIWIGKNSNKCSNIVDVKEKEKKNEDNDQNKGITLEDNDLLIKDIEKFLEPLTSTYPFYNHLLTIDDDFINSIRFSVANNKYTKEGDKFIFNKKEIDELSYKYFGQSYVYHINDDRLFKYNETNNTYEGVINYGLYSSTPGPQEIVKKASDIKLSGNYIDLLYSLTYNYDNKIDFQSVEMKFNITLVKENSDFRILDVKRLK